MDYKGLGFFFFYILKDVTQFNSVFWDIKTWELITFLWKTCLSTTNFLERWCCLKMLEAGLDDPIWGPFQPELFYDKNVPMALGEKRDPTPVSH